MTVARRRRRPQMLPKANNHFQIAYPQIFVFSSLYQAPYKPQVPYSSSLGETMAKPFLRWAGSKRQLLTRLIDHWPGGNTRYVEPFAGSASLFFELEPPSALLSDINGELISTYQVVCEHPRAVYRSLIRWDNDRTQYYKIRSLQPSDLEILDQAARFIYLNRFCFNGLYRTNGRGDFNVPYGGEKGGSLPSEDLLVSAAAQLSRAELLCGDLRAY